MKLKLRPNVIVITGVAIGLSAALGQAFLHIQPPEAYGVCMVGHPSVLVKWLLNNIWHTNLSITSAFVIYPSLLAVGLVVGALIASAKNKELIRQPSTAKNKYGAILLGFLVANLGLVVGACPIRTGLLVAYGSLLGVVALGGIVTGVFLGVWHLRRAK
ncbi:MAG: cytochrome C [Dehalococcoidia bacterium]|nr:MAG: cytochrome C [Dehalococcoidia bacterium]